MIELKNVSICISIHWSQLMFSNVVMAMRGVGHCRFVTFDRVDND